MVTLRGIAADANVSAALIVKHFGSKESLFEQVADFSEAAELLLAAPDAELGRHAVLHAGELSSRPRADLLVRVIFAAGNGDERALIREHFRDQVTRAFAARLTGADAELRAGTRSPANCSASAPHSRSTRPARSPPLTPEAIADLYAPALQAAYPLIEQRVLECGRALGPACDAANMGDQARGAATGPGPPRSTWSTDRKGASGSFLEVDGMMSDNGAARAAGPAGRGARRRLGHDAAGRRADARGLPRRPLRPTTRTTSPATRTCST